ncbi:MAG TPA: hypothetical protein VGE07_31265 [Herpetosiphonaceae bacterium]
MTHVIKISGHEVEQPRALHALITLLIDHPGQIVLVHGGGSILPRALARVGIDSAAVAETAAMALRGGINSQLVAALVERHIQAIGLSGVDLELMYLQRGDTVPVVRFEVLKYLLDQAWVPVLAPIALDMATGRGQVLNADATAQIVASALGADELTFIVNTPGVLSGGKRVTGISARQHELYIKQGVIGADYASVVRAAAGAAPSVGRVRITDLGGLQAGGGTMVVV